jgi:hypothetical protein
MKRTIVVIIVCFCLFLGAKPVELSASTITSSFLGPGWTPVEESIAYAAITEWTDHLSLPQPVSLYFGLADLGGYTLGQTSNFYEWIPSELPAQATITIDTRSWISWNLASPESGYYDALSILAHEVGHAIGFADVFPGFQSHVTYDASGNPYFDSYPLYKQYSPSHMNDPNDLMYPYVDTDQRRTPSYGDLDILHIAYGYQIVPLPATLLLFGPALVGLMAIRRRFKK